MTKTSAVYAEAGLVTNVLVVFCCLCGAIVAHAQAPPQLPKDQRALLQAVMQAVDAAANHPVQLDQSWPIHVLPASDGLHYVAFSVEPSASTTLSAGPVMLDVRLAPRRALDQAAGRKFIDLLAEEPVPHPEQATRIALMALALSAIGDASALGAPAEGV